jgi:4-hydroxybenzoyl-CoA reductase subunit beta
LNDSLYIRPPTVDEALVKAAEHQGDYLYFGGGTDIQIYRKQELARQRTVIDLSDIDGLRAIQKGKDGLTIGSMVTLDEIITAAVIQDEFPLIAEAAKSVATPVVRKSATIGGNLLVQNRCTFYNQSKAWRKAIGSCLKEVGDICQVTGGKDKCFARNVSDTAPALMVLEATVVIHNRDAIVGIPLKDIYVADGIQEHIHLDDDAILTEIKIAREPERWWFRKLRLRRSVDFTSLTVAATVDSDGTARVCLNGVSMAPVLVEQPLSSMTLEDLIRRARKECKTVDNDMMPLKYRREMIDVYLTDWWHSIADAR